MKYSRTCIISNMFLCKNKHIMHLLSFSRKVVILFVILWMVACRWWWWRWKWWSPDRLSFDHKVWKIMLLLFLWKKNSASSLQCTTKLFDGSGKTTSCKIHLQPSTNVFLFVKLNMKSKLKSTVVLHVFWTFYFLKNLNVPRTGLPLRILHLLTWSMSEFEWTTEAASF